MTRRSRTGTRLGALAGVVMLAAACSSTPSASPAAGTVPAHGTVPAPGKTAAPGKARARHGTKAVTGVVQSVSASSLEVKSRRIAKTIALDAATRYSRGHTNVSAAAITKGERVRVRLVAGDTVPTAATIVIMFPKISGTVSALSASGFTLTSRGGVVHSITVSPSTSYKVRRAAASAASLHDGVKVTVSGTLRTSGAMAANTVDVLP